MCVIDQEKSNYLIINLTIKVKRLCLIFVLIIISQLSLAKGDKPLLMANKKNLYQRVLALPNAMLYDQTTDSEQNSEELPVFSVYYVYSRKNSN